MTNQSSKMRMDAYEVRGKAYQRYAGRKNVVKFCVTTSSQKAGFAGRTICSIT